MSFSSLGANQLAQTEVVTTDCSVCLSAGSARRGVCDICGAETSHTERVPVTAGS